MVHSLSTLLMYSDLQTNGLGLFSIDSTSHDEQAMNTLKQLFDGVITVPGTRPKIRLAWIAACWPGAVRRFNPRDRVRTAMPITDDGDSTDCSTPTPSP